MLVYCEGDEISLLIQTNKKREYRCQIPNFRIFISTPYKHCHSNIIHTLNKMEKHKC